MDWHLGDLITWQPGHVFSYSTCSGNVYCSGIMFGKRIMKVLIKNCLANWHAK